jgi:competence protein ComEC
MHNVSKKKIILGILFLLTAVSLLFFYLENNKSLKVVFFDVGQGDSIFIESPNGKQILIDGGPDNTVVSRLSKFMPFWDRSIDIVIATHGDSDHISGLPEVLKYYKVDLFIDNGKESDSEIYLILNNILKSKNIKRIKADSEQFIVLDKEREIYLDILHPSVEVGEVDTNDASVVSKLTYKGQSFLFTGDAGIYAENLMTQKYSRKYLKSNILKLGHHGSDTSSSLMWLKTINPDEVVISAGKDNRYGHPSDGILERLKALNIPFLETSKEGDIVYKIR